jgi:hypothetical protein
MPGAENGAPSRYCGCPVPEESIRGGSGRPIVQRLEWERSSRSFVGNVNAVACRAPENLLRRRALRVDNGSARSPNGAIPLWEGHSSLVSCAGRMPLRREMGKYGAFRVGGASINGITVSDRMEPRDDPRLGAVSRKCPDTGMTGRLQCPTAHR